MALKKKKGSLGVGVYRLYSEKEKDLYIGALVAQWEKERKTPRVQKKPFITVSREFGCMALEMGLRFTERLDKLNDGGPKWMMYDREIVKRIASDLKMSERLVEIITASSRTRVRKYMDAHFEKWPSEDEVFQNMVHVTRSICEKGNAVVVGFAACKIAQDLPKGFHIRIVAPVEWRIEQVASFYKISKEAAKKRIHLTDGGRASFFRNRFKEDVRNPYLFDLILNQAKLSMDQIVGCVIHAMKEKGLVTG